MHTNTHTGFLDGLPRLAGERAKCSHLRLTVSLRALSPSKGLTGTCGHRLYSWLVPVTWRLRTTTGPLVTGQRVQSAKTKATAHYDSPCYGHTLTHTHTHSLRLGTEKNIPSLQQHSSSSKAEWECGAVSMALLAASLEHYTDYRHHLS